MNNKTTSNFQSVDKKAKKESFVHKMGDSIERLGEKVADAGATKLGNAIRKTGDKIEHSRDNKTTR